MDATDRQFIRSVACVGAVVAALGATGVAVEKVAGLFFSGPVSVNCDARTANPGVIRMTSSNWSVDGTPTQHTTCVEMSR
jgi:hypothetical protein